MAGAVVENLSNRKLFCILAALTLVQITFFLLGGLIAPSPSSSMEVLMLPCRDTSSGKDQSRWFWTRPQGKGCRPIEEPPPYLGLHPEEIVFVAQLPLPRNNIDLEYSPWFQNLLGVLVPEISYDSEGQWRMGNKPELKMDVRLGYRNHADDKDEWKELVHTTVSRQLDCSIEDRQKKDGFYYSCSPIELFELGSNDYPFYLLNLRIPVSENDTANREIGKWEELRLIAIHQNGGFTKVWLSLKTALTPILFATLVWYWRRILQMARAPILLEKVLFALGITVTFLNFPIEWLSLWIRMPFMLLLSDIRQGIFYAMLASFWLIFVGEHLMDDGGKNRLSNYWKHLSAVIFGCICLFVFDMCERGIHLTNPFYSIWATRLGTSLAYGFILVAAICACVYFVFLCYLIVRVWMTIKRRRASANQMHERRRLRFEGIIYRFKFLMATTLVCAALTVAGFIMGQVGEGQLRWGDYEDAPSLQYTSAFLTGVYGMWNIYVFLLLAMYAPSHKEYDQAVRVPVDDDDDDVIFPQEAGGAVTEASALTTFLKPAMD